MVNKTVTFSKDAYLALFKHIQEELDRFESRLAPDFVDYDDFGQPRYAWQVEQRAEAEALFPIWKKIYESLLGISED